MDLNNKNLCGGGCTFREYSNRTFPYKGGVVC